MFYVSSPGHGHQEADTLADARTFARAYKAAREIDEVRIVDALDRTQRGYRIIEEWAREGKRWVKVTGGTRAHL